MVQEKESFLPWSTETQGMTTRQASRRGRPRSSSATAPDIIGSPDAVSEEAVENPTKRQRAGARSGKTPSELPRKRHVQDPAGTKPRRMKQSPMVPNGSIKNKEPVQLKEALVESNCGDTSLPTGEIPTNHTATGVGSSAGGLPPKSTVVVPQLEDAGDRQVRESPEGIPVPSLEEGQAQPKHASGHNAMPDREEIAELSPPGEVDRYTSTLKETKGKNAALESKDSGGYVRRKKNDKRRHGRRSYSRSDSDTFEVEYRERRVHGRERRERSPRRQRKGRYYSTDIHHRRHGHKHAWRRRHYSRDSEQSYSSGSSSDSPRRRKRRTSHREYGRTHIVTHAPLGKYRSSPHRHRDLKRIHSVHEREHKTGRSSNPPSSDTESGREPIRAEEMTEAEKRKDHRDKKADADRLTA